MKNIFITFGLVIFFANVSFAQTQTAKKMVVSTTKVNVPINEKIYLITLDLAGIPQPVQEKLMDQLFAYKNKVISIDYNQTKQIIQVQQNGSEPNRTIMEIVNNFNTQYNVVISNVFQAKK